MQLPISTAKARLTDLIRRAEAGEDVVLTRHGRPVVRFVPVKRRTTPEERRRLLEAVRASGRARALPGECAARSQDFLYGPDGLPA